MSLAHFYQKLLAKHVRRPDDVIMWPQMTFQREMMQQRTGNIKHSLSDYDSGWVGQIWCILEVLIFSPLSYNGEVTKLTWPKVTDIKNTKYTTCRHLCPYCTLRVSKGSDHWCAFGTMSNFKKRNLRSCHLMWPGGVTFGVIVSSFFWKSAFFRYLRKTWGGRITAPPGRARVKIMMRVRHHIFGTVHLFFSKILLFILTTRVMREHCDSALTLAPLGSGS